MIGPKGREILLRVLQKYGNSWSMGNYKLSDPSILDIHSMGISNIIDTFSEEVLGGWF